MHQKLIQILLKHLENFLPLKAKFKNVIALTICFLQLSWLSLEKVPLHLNIKELIKQQVMINLNIILEKKGKCLMKSDKPMRRIRNMIIIQN